MRSFGKEFDVSRLSPESARNNRAAVGGAKKLLTVLLPEIAKFEAGQTRTPDKKMPARGGHFLALRRITSSWRALLQARRQQQRLALFASMLLLRRVLLHLQQERLLLRQRMPLQTRRLSCHGHGTRGLRPLAA